MRNKLEISQSELSDFEVTKELAELLGETCYPVSPNGTSVQIDTGALRWVKTLDFCHRWSDIMPIAIKLGVYCKPLAWERLDRKLYRAEHICMAEEIDSESGSKLSMSGMGTRFMTDDESPERALALSCIKVLQDLKISKRKKVLPSDYD